ncbi:MAG: Hcp family type VI secretion system effector [Gemmataceae bacterium]
MAVDMFIRVGPKDGTFKGESRDKVHAGLIDVLAWSWGMSNSGSAHTGGGIGAGKANVQDVSFTKYIDASSAALMLACCTGEHITDAEIIVRKAGTTPVEYVKITMTEVMVTAVSTGGSGGEDRLTENVTLNFAKVKFEYVEQDATGKAKTPSKAMTYDIAQNVKE